MPIITDNRFTHDTYDMRSERLNLLKHNLGDYTGELSVPSDLIDWAEGNPGATPPVIAAFDAWTTALVAANLAKGEVDDAYAVFHAAYDKVREHYQQVKDLFKANIDKYGSDRDVADELGIKGRTPAKFMALRNAIVQMKDANDKLTTAGSPLALPSTMVDPLVTEIDDALDLRNNAGDEGEESKTAHSVVSDLYLADVENLRLIYNYCVIVWGKFDERLANLGFQPHVKHGGGQPDAPANLAADWDAPTLTLSWDAVETATSYQLAYSLDGDEWEELYAGDLTSHSYAAQLGEKRWYMVRARNQNGYGEWSDEISFQPTE